MLPYQWKAREIDSVEDPGGVPWVPWNPPFTRKHLCALKDSSSYGHKIHLHHSTCGLFLHYRWTDFKNKEHVEVVQ